MSETEITDNKKRLNDDKKEDTIGDENNRKKIKLETDKDETKEESQEDNKKELEEDKEEENKEEENKENTKKDIDTTASNDKKAQEEEGKDKIAKTEESKPKYVFGSATSIGSRFNITKPGDKQETEKSSNDNDNANDEDKQGENGDDNTEIKKPFAFGSKFSFGSGFGVLKQTKQSEDKPDKDATPKFDEIPSKEKTVNLHKQEVKSGEEAETCLLQLNCKLYQLHDIKDGWKERGVGTLKLNKDTTTNKSRIVMRSRGVLTVILNLPLLNKFTILKGFPGSLHSEKFIRIIAIDDNNKPVTYAIKCGNTGLIDNLYDSIMELLKGRS